MKTILVLTLLVFMISLDPTDVDLVEGHVRRPVRHPTGPVIRGGLRRDLQWPQPFWQRMIMLEAGKRDKRGPLEISASINEETEAIGELKDCQAICNRRNSPDSEEVCQACERRCPDRCCQVGQLPTACPTRAVESDDSPTILQSNINFVFNSPAVDASCFSNCVGITDTCPKIIRRCELCTNCCQEEDAVTDGCRSNRP